MSVKRPGLRSKGLYSGPSSATHILCNLEEMCFLLLNLFSLHKIARLGYLQFIRFVVVRFHAHTVEDIVDGPPDPTGHPHTHTASVRLLPASVGFVSDSLNLDRFSVQPLSF